MDLLHAKDAETALGFYLQGATVVSNGVLFPSFDAVVAEIRTFYSTLQEINLAVRDEVRVDVISRDAVMFTATFRWCSTDMAGEKLALSGVWSALFVRDEGHWKIHYRHESFLPSQEQSESQVGSHE